MLPRLLLSLLMLAATPWAALAQEAPWPNRPITILGGFPNGAGTEIYARRLSDPLSRALGVPVVVDNKSGAGGNIASDFVAKARPDGYLFLLGTAGTHAINATLYRNLPFNPLRDVTHIALLGDVPNVMLVNQQHTPGFRSCADVLAAARARPGALNYGSTGNGASTHLAGAAFATAFGLQLQHIPYRGQPGAMEALLKGDVQLFFNQTGPAIALIQQGQAQGLTVMQNTRVPALPDLPTVTVACGQEMNTSTWYGLFAPPGLPAAIQARMNAEVAKIIRTPAFTDWLVMNQGIVPPTDLTPEGFRRTHEADIARWATVVRASGAQVD